jgi:hypothetical protein
MNCRRVEPLLSSYLEGRLSKRRGEAIATHLQGCPECRRLQEEILAVGDELRSVAAPLPPADLRRRVADRWTAERVRTASCGRRGFLGMTPCSKGTRPARRRTLGASALAAALLMFLLLELVRWQSDRSAPPHGPRIAWQPRDVPIAPEPREPRPRPVKDPGQQRHPDARTQAGHRDELDGAPSGRSRSPRSGSHSFRPDGSRPVPPAPANDHPRNPSSMREARRSDPLPADAWDAFEERVRRHVRVRDDFVRISFPRIASTSDRQIAEAVESYKREAAIVDVRLAREVTLQQKATALSDLCERLRADTGIRLEAGPSVADEKVTIFCEKLPLRDVMRQLSRPFGYTWLRSGKTGEYRYELVQDLRSQLLEEELRNRDRNAALLALEQELEKYRPYLRLTPDEILARAKTASPAEKKVLEELSGPGYGPIQMYFGLSPQELAVIRTGQWIAFSVDPRPGDVLLPRVPNAVLRPGEQPLPPDVARGILQSWRWERIVRGPKGLSLVGAEAPDSVPVASVPEVRPWLTLTLDQSEPGVFSLVGNPGLRSPGFGLRGVLAVITGGRSPKVLQPENETANARLAGDPNLRPRLSVQPHPSCRSTLAPTAPAESLPEPKVTTADVLETLHRASGLPLVADAYTRLYKPETVTVRDQSRFAALNRLSDTMRLRWNKEGNWLQFRSTSFYDDRLKEVPNRLLTRWTAARRQHGFLTLEDLLEIAQLPDAPLKGDEMAEGARVCCGLAEWDLARNQMVLANLRFLAQFTPAQRQEAMTTAGLPFTKMTLPEQQGFIDRAVGSRAVGLKEGDGLRSLEDLAGATLRVDYSQPGWYEWRPPGERAHSWVVPLGPPPDGRRVLVPVVRERTREAALQALRRVDPQIREAVWKSTLRWDLQGDQIPPTEEAQIVATKLDLTTLYIPCATTKFRVQFQSTNSQMVDLGDWGW